jgi:hypothetical protein
MQDFVRHFAPTEITASSGVSSLTGADVATAQEKRA